VVFAREERGERGHEFRANEIANRVHRVNDRLLANARRSGVARKDNVQEDTLRQPNRPVKLADEAREDRSLGERTREHVPPEDYERILRTVQRGREVFDGRVVWNVNSTAQGGGVAEMLVSLLAYARAAGIDARWVVIAGNEEFFVLTKRIHYFLHGSSEHRPEALQVECADGHVGERGRVADHMHLDATCHHTDEALLAAEMPSVATGLTDADHVARRCHELSASTKPLTRLDRRRRQRRILGV
jgi:hypothetical protein